MQNDRSHVTTVFPFFAFWHVLINLVVTGVELGSLLFVETGYHKCL